MLGEGVAPNRASEASAKMQIRMERDITECLSDLTVTAAGRGNHRVARSEKQPCWGDGCNWVFTLGMYLENWYLNRKLAMAVDKDVR